MQYMFFSCAWIFSPGWNRITTIAIRFWHNAVFDEARKQCFYMNYWTKTGYYYTPSFIIGGMWTIGWWLHPRSPFRAPMFKKYSTGFWLISILMMIGAGALMEFS